MKNRSHKLTESTLIEGVMGVCAKAESRGMPEEEVAEQLLLATVTRMFLTLGEPATGQALRNALNDVEQGDFARLLEQAGLIEWVPFC